MKINIGDEYRIRTDEYQFIVEKKGIVEAGRLTKEENIGKEKWSILGYYGDIDFALKSIARNVLISNDDINVIIDKLNLIQSEIKGIKNLLEVRRNDLSIK